MMQRVFAAFSLLALPLFAQDRAAVNGTVTDPSGAVVSGAGVDLNSPATGLHRAVLTNEDKSYEIIPLPVGAYTMTISKVGFNPRQSAKSICNTARPERSMPDWKSVVRPTRWKSPR